MDEISTVTCPSLTEINVEHLHTRGIIKLVDFFKYSRNTIIRVACFNIWRYEALKYDIQCRLNPESCPPVSIGIVATGIKRMDQALHGGFRVGEIVEIFGRPGAGKSKLCISMALQCLQQKNSMAVYIDTRNEFSENTSKFPRQSKRVLQRLRIYKRFTLEDIIQTLTDINYEISVGQMNMYNQLRILIVDSLPMKIPRDVNSTDYAWWRHHLESFMQHIRHLAGRGFLIVVVNHAVSSRNKKMDDSSRFCQMEPGLEKYWTHEPNFSIGLAASRTSSIIHVEFIKSSREVLKRVFPIEKFYNGAG